MKKLIFLNILAFLVAASSTGTSALANSATNKSGTKDKDLKIINSARRLYEKNKLTEAIAKYNEVSKASDYWVESVEEKAWAHTKSQDYDKALGELKSALNPVFLPLAGPETIMLATFVDFKICNYKGVFEKIKTYKDIMLPRVEAMESITSNPKSDFITNWISKLAKEDISSTNLGSDISKLPRFFYNDKLLITEAKKYVQNKSPKNLQSAQNRIANLANQDLEDISKNLKKMKIIEVEVIQRSYLYEKEGLQGDLKFDKKKSADVLTFPDEVDSNEVWLDEIGNYEVKTMKCPTNPKSTGTVVPGGPS